MSEDQSYNIDHILKEMRSDYWRNLEEADVEAGVAGEEYLVVHYDDDRYGLLASSCSEVLKLPRLVPVPRLPDHLKGIFNLRGEIVAVTDMRPLLGLSERQGDDRSRLVVVSEGVIKTALLVDAVEGLVRVEDEKIEPLAEGAAKGLRDLIKGKVVDGKETLVLIDLTRLLERPDMVVDQKAREVT